jgi:hypothetical protein
MSGISSFSRFASFYITAFLSTVWTVEKTLSPEKQFPAFVPLLLVFLLGVFTVIGWRGRN